jgi:hypothetical protein
MLSLFRFCFFILLACTALAGCSAANFNGEFQRITRYGCAEPSGTYRCAIIVNRVVTHATTPWVQAPGGPIGPGTIGGPLSEYSSIDSSNYRGEVPFACLTTAEIGGLSNGGKGLHFIGIGGRTDTLGAGNLNSIDLTLDISLLSMDEQQWLLPSAQSLPVLHSLTSAPFIKVTEVQIMSLT